MTIGALKSLREHGLSIPQDISLISFDRIDMFNILGLDISYIDGSTEKLGEIGMTLLLEVLNDKYVKESKTITLKSSLVQKGSEKFFNNNI